MYQNLSQAVENLERAIDLLQGPVGGRTQDVIEGLIESSREIVTTVHLHYYYQDRQSALKGS